MQIIVKQLFLLLVLPAAIANVCGPGTTSYTIGTKESTNGKAFKRSLNQKLGGGPRVSVHAYDGTGLTGETLAGFDDENAQAELFATRKLVIKEDSRGYYGVGVKLQTRQKTEEYKAAKAKKRDLKDKERQAKQLEREKRYKEKLAAREQRKAEKKAAADARKVLRAEEKARKAEEREEKRIEKQAERDRKRAEKAIQRAEERRQKEEQRAAAKAARDAEKAAAKAARDAERAEAQAERAAQKAERDAERAAQRAAAKAAKEAERAAAKKAREEAKAARDAEREAARLAREAEKEKARAEQEARRAQRQKEREAKRAAREAKKAQQAAERAAKKAEQEAAKAAKRAEQEAAKAAKKAEKDAKKAARKNKNGQRHLQSDDEYEISGSDVLRFDFGCLEFKYLMVGASNLFIDETGLYRAYKSGKKVLEGTFDGHVNGAVEFPISSEEGFDAIEFLVGSEGSTYLVSYLQYCKAGTCSGNVASWSGDPHMKSFDGLRWDCQGHGHFLAFQGIKGNGDEDFQVQAIFDKRPGVTKKVTVTRSVLIDSGIEGAPVLQLSVPRTTDNGCDYSFYVDGVLADLNSWSDPGEEVQLKTACGGGRSTGKRLTFSYPDTETEVTVSVKASKSNGCVIATSICLGSYWDATDNEVRGLLGGKKNGNTSDDWIDRDGVPVAIDELGKKGAAAYDFCTDNWCMTEAEAAKFTYAPGEDFTTYDLCTDTYDRTTEELVELAEENPVFAAGKAGKAYCTGAFGDDEDNLDNCFLEVGLALENKGDPVQAAKDYEGDLEDLEKERELEGIDPDVAVEDEADIVYSAGGAKERPGQQNDNYEAGQVTEIGGGARGDPHIKTWDGKLYDFHGICDLVLLQNSGFQNGLGMDIHMRTKKMRQWSYISTAVLRIGDDTFEVMGERKENHYWVNGVLGEDVSHGSILPTTISGYPIQFFQVNSQQKQYVVDLGQGEKIVFKTWQSMVRVDVVGGTAENFKSSLGLMGTYKDSLKMARDNTTILENVNDFGQEWQVLENEHVLFHNIDGPQAPARCQVPSQVQLRRNLAASSITLEASQNACKGILDKDDFDLCVFDVMAANDLSVAGAY